MRGETIESSQVRVSLLRVQEEDAISILNPPPAYPTQKDLCTDNPRQLYGQPQTALWTTPDIFVETMAARLFDGMR
jgi:hypothetical protein